MIYLDVIKKYARTFLTTFIYLSFLGLFYFFYLLLGMKFRGEQAILLEALKNYALLLVHSLPLMAIFATFIFFAKIESNDTRFMIRVMPIIGALNTVVLVLFFFFRWDFVNFMHYEPLSIKPLPQAGYITPYGNTQVYIAEGKGRHLVFTGDIYLASSWRTNASTLTVQAVSRVGDASFTPDGRVFSLSLKEKAPAFQETGFTKIFFEAYFAYVRKLREVFFHTFYSWGIVSSLLGILFMSAGYFSLLAGISIYLKEAQIQMLMRSFFVLLGVAAWFSFPHFLSFISLMSFGIRFGLLRVAFPSLLMGSLAALLGYGLLILKNGLPRKA
ncbi:hypothetical protein BREVNS_0772 [Brevinematales bacterium NS]|nr:hypothetical protein [Brevinematales bacterium]QJR21522.1 hypothetical protein BREVNS_0772 [Brevinematales bacterium NS]